MDLPSGMIGTHANQALCVIEFGGVFWTADCRYEEPTDHELGSPGSA
jgi:hypothetical protein